MFSMPSSAPDGPAGMCRRKSPMNPPSSKKVLSSPVIIGNQGRDEGQVRVGEEIAGREAEIGAGFSIRVSVYQSNRPRVKR